MVRIRFTLLVIFNAQNIILTIVPIVFIRSPELIPLKIGHLYLLAFMIWMLSPKSTFFERIASSKITCCWYSKSMFRNWMSHQIFPITPSWALASKNENVISMVLEGINILIQKDKLWVLVHTLMVAGIFQNQHQFNLKCLHLWDNWTWLGISYLRIRALWILVAHCNLLENF